MAYIYRHIRLDTNEPFYIGLATDEDRGYLRSRSKEYRNKHWKSIFALTPIRIEIVLDRLTRVEAINKEIELIKLYGRRDLDAGSLVNLTDGGDGVKNISYQTRLMFKTTKGIKRTQEIVDMLKKRVGENNPNFGRKHKKSVILELSKRKSGANNPMFGVSLDVNCKVVMNKDYGIFYKSIAEAAYCEGINYGTLRAYLNGKLKNKSNLTLA